MGRPKGSRNRSKDRPVVGNPIPTEQEGTANVEEQPNTASPSDALASPETLAPGDATQGGPTPAFAVTPVVGMRIAHKDGDAGEIVGVEPRGNMNAVSVQWDTEDDPTAYTPVDWQDIAGQCIVIDSAPDAAPLSATRVLPSVSRSLDDIGHDMAEAQSQLDDLEREKAAIVKDYGKRIGTVAQRVSELAAEYRQAERREEIDYDLGVVNVYSNRTGELLATRPLADSERQQVLPLDHPLSPPEPELDEDEDGNPEAEEG